MSHLPREQGHCGRLSVPLSCSENKQRSSLMNFSLSPFHFLPLHVSSTSPVTDTLSLASTCPGQRAIVRVMPYFTDWQNENPKESSDLPKVVKEPEPNQGRLGTVNWATHLSTRTNNPVVIKTSNDRIINGELCHRRGGKIKHRGLPCIPCSSLALRPCVKHCPGSSFGLLNWKTKLIALTS